MNVPSRAIKKRQKMKKEKILFKLNRILDRHGLKLDDLHC